MGLHLLHTVLKGDPTVYLHHALDCMTAGGMPSFGTDDSAERNRRAYEALAAIINPRAPWVGGESVPYVGLFRRKGELILHVQNGIGYSETLKSAASPLLRPPSLRRSVHLDIEAYPVRKVELVAGESGKQPVVHPGKNGTTIILPELAWGAVFRLEI